MAPVLEVAESTVRQWFVQTVADTLQRQPVPGATAGLRAALTDLGARDPQHAPRLRAGMPIGQPPPPPLLTPLQQQDLETAMSAIDCAGTDPLLVQIWAESGQNLQRASQRFMQHAAAFGREPATEQKLSALSCPVASCEFAYANHEATNLDPAHMETIHELQLGIQIFEGLLAVAPHDGPPEPGVAKYYTRSDDGLRYTFYLRDNAVWSDHTAAAPHYVTAEDFLYSWRRTLDPKTTGPGAVVFAAIKNAPAFTQGTVDFAAVGIKALDASIVEVTLEYPLDAFPNLTADLRYAPLPRATVERWGPQWLRPEHIVTNGAYRLHEHQLDNVTHLRKFAGYWDADQVQVDSVVMYATPSEETALQWYELGKVDWFFRLPSARIEQLLRDGRSDLFIDQISSLAELMFNVDPTKQLPFHDQRVREAFSRAIDRDLLVKQVLKGGGDVPATNFVPRIFATTHGYRSPKWAAVFDPTQARQLLADAGYQNGHDFPEITIAYSTSENNRLLAEFTQRQLKDHLGITVQIHNTELGTMLANLSEGNFQIARRGFGADMPDYLDYLTRFTTGHEGNNGHFSDPAYDALVEQCQREPNLAERNRLAGEAESILNHALPSIMLYFQGRAYLRRLHWAGFGRTTNELHPFKPLRRLPD